MKVDEKRLRILKNALVVFFRYGYRRVNMAEIAEAAGISRPGLYLYFKTKEEVFTAAIVQHAEDLLSEILSELDRKKTAEDKIMYAFEIWTLRTFDESLKSPEAKEMSEGNLAFAGEGFDQSRRKFEGILTSVLDAHFKSSKLKKTASAEKVAHLIYSAMRGFKLAAKNSSELRKMIQDLLKLIGI